MSQISDNYVSQICDSSRFSLYFSAGPVQFPVYDAPVHSKAFGSFRYHSAAFLQYFGDVLSLHLICKFFEGQTVVSQKRVSYFREVRPVRGGGYRSKDQLVPPAYHVYTFNYVFSFSSLRNSSAKGIMSSGRSASLGSFRVNTASL